MGGGGYEGLGGSSDMGGLWGRFEAGAGLEWAGGFAGLVGLRRDVPGLEVVGMFR